MEEETQSSSFENSNYGRRFYGFGNKKNIKKMPLPTKIVLGTVLCLALLSLGAFLLSYQMKSDENKYTPGQKDRLIGNITTFSAGVFPEIFKGNEKSSKNDSNLTDITKYEMLSSSSEYNITNRIKEQYNAVPEGGNENVTILFWSGTISRNFRLEGVPEKFKDKCLVTYNQSDFHKADVVVFNSEDYPGKERASKDQVFVYGSISPVAEKTLQNIPKFDWTATFSGNSTVPVLPMIYTPKTDYEKIEISKNETQTDLKIAVYFEKGHENNDFEDEIRKVNASITVDVYDFRNNESKKECYNLNIKNCLKKIKSNYKFYLVLENQICSDYVSISFFRALKAGLIPIVLNGPPKYIYELMAPPQSKKSFIHYEDFSRNDFIKLRKILDSINKSEEKFLEYFKWTEKYYIKTNYAWYNQLCNMFNLHRKVVRARPFTSVSSKENGITCRKP